MNFRHKIKTQLHGFTYLMEVLDLIVSDKSQLNDDDVRLTCEILKTLFNVTLTVDRNCLDEVSFAAHSFALENTFFRLKLVSLYCKTSSFWISQMQYLFWNFIPQEEEAHCQRLVSVLHDLLLTKTTPKDKAEELQRWVFGYWQMGLVPNGMSLSIYYEGNV